MKRTALSVLAMALVASVSSCALIRSPATTWGLDLSSPEATVISFTKAAATRNVGRAQACFIPGSTGYNDIKKVLTAEPSSPLYQGRMMLEAVDPNVPMPIVWKRGARDWVRIGWRVASRKGAKIEGQTIQPGMVFDFEAMLKKRDGKWLIEKF